MNNKSIPAQIIEAIKNEDINVIRILFEAHPEQIYFYTPFGGATWLGYAASQGKLRATNELVDLGIDLNKGDKRDNSLPICNAARNGHLNIVKYLVENNSTLNVSLSVRNPLFAAIVGRSSSIVKLLLEAGVDTTVVYNSNTMKNMDAVAFALMRGEIECANIIALHNSKGNTIHAQEALEQADLIAYENAHGKKKT